MPSPRSKADFERMRPDFLYFIKRTGLGRLSSDLVLERSADGTFGLPPKHDFERDGPIYFGWDVGAGDDMTVVTIRNGDLVAFTTITETEKEPKP